MKLRKRTVIFGAALFLLGVMGAYALLRRAPAGPRPAIEPIAEPALVEASGLAPSQRTADLLWALNDSRNGRMVYGIGMDGRPLGRLRVTGAENHDWEALACYRLDGREWLAIGDIGDNGANRKRVAIHFLEEPPATVLGAGRESTVKIQWSLWFRYDDGPRDCEAFVVDTATRQILLFSKRNRPSHVYGLSLSPTAPGTLAVAKRIGNVTHIPQPNSFQKLVPSPTGRFRGQPTDAALSNDGSRVAILTYGEPLVYVRRNEDTWSAVFAREPILLPEHGLSQAEAVCFSADGKELLVTGEQQKPVLLRYRLE